MNEQNNLDEKLDVDFSKIMNEIFKSKIIMENKNFVNGFQSWQETHFEVVSFINNPDNTNSPIIQKVYEENGTGGMYELAENLTNEFEELNKDKKWDGEFFDEIYSFLFDKLINLK